jgi:hypothetical protein
VEKTRGLYKEPRKFADERRRQVEPILEEFLRWLQRRASHIPPETLLGKAIGYTLGQWRKLTRYLDHHAIGPDTNAVENAISAICRRPKELVILWQPSWRHRERDAVQHHRNSSRQRQGTLLVSTRVVRQTSDSPLEGRHPVPRSVSGHETLTGCGVGFTTRLRSFTNKATE